MLVAVPAMLDPGQQSIVDELMTEGRAIRWTLWTGMRDILEQIDSLVSLESNSAIWLLPRKNPKKIDAPLVVHLINHSYDESTDTIETQTNIFARVRTETFDGRPLLKATLLRPNNEPLDHSFENDPDGVMVAVPRLYVWSIVKLECSAMHPKD